MLSILIPIYNYNITHLVENIHKQCMACSIVFEIICLDDNSGRNFQLRNQKIKDLAYCFYSESETNLGRTKTRQLLAEKAIFDWLLFLDADVIPSTDTFIQNYIYTLKSDFLVVFGGYQYDKNKPDFSKTLRYRYGKEREEKSADFRSKNPYQFVFSGNMLIQKKLFLNLTFKEKEKFYGMDIFFGYQLFANRIQIKHIENAIIHLGLESNEVFFEKVLESVISRKQFLENKSGVELMNPLMNYYKKIKKYNLVPLVRFLFKVSEKHLKKNIVGKNPNLFYFDLYRLGYICSVKNK